LHAPAATAALVPDPVVNVTVPDAPLRTRYDFSRFGMVTVPPVPPVMSSTRLRLSSLAALFVLSVFDPDSANAVTPSVDSSTISITLSLRRSPQLLLFSPAACFSRRFRLV
jgi:hypothetical protein